MQKCPGCGRIIRTGRTGILLEHYPKQGSWPGGPCIGSGYTVNETKKELESESA